jgi:hypothetical protein
MYARSAYSWDGVGDGLNWSNDGVVDREGCSAEGNISQVVVVFFHHQLSMCCWFISSMNTNTLTVSSSTVISYAVLFLLVTSHSNFDEDAMSRKQI